MHKKFTSVVNLVLFKSQLHELFWNKHICILESLFTLLLAFRSKYDWDQQ